MTTNRSATSGPSPFPRPVAVLVIAVLSVIWGGVGMCCNGIFVSSPFTEPVLERAFDGGQDPQGEPALVNLGDTWPEVARWAGSIFALVLSVLLIVAGVGLLGMRPWARRLALACACAAILFTAADGVLACYEWSSTRENVTKEWGPMGWLFASPLVFGLEIGYGLLEIAFSVAVLVILLRRSVAEAFVACRRSVGSPGT